MNRYFNTIEMLRKRFPQDLNKYRKEAEERVSNSIALRIMERARITGSGRIEADEHDNWALTQWE